MTPKLRDMKTWLEEELAKPRPHLEWVATQRSIIKGIELALEEVKPVLVAARRGLYFIPMGQPEYKQLEDALAELEVQDD